MDPTTTLRACMKLMSAGVFVRIVVPKGRFREFFCFMVIACGKEISGHFGALFIGDIRFVVKHGTYPLGSQTVRL